MKILCAPAKAAYPGADVDLRVDLLSHSGFKSRGHIGAMIADRIGREKLAPAARAWDLLALALSVVAADHANHRAASADGWAREIHIVVAVREPEFWNARAGLIQELLAFLTTDLWKVEFVKGGFSPTPPNPPVCLPEDAVVLLSGGLDSLVGAIDLTANGRLPVAVSQVVRGDAEKQSRFASLLGPKKGLRLIQLNHNVDLPDPETPPSQRSRSLIFLAYGVLVATTLDIYDQTKPVDLFVCENGFISINPPLTGTRIGSLSTRTTHPVVLSLFQELLDSAGLSVKLSNPYQLNTKGEMLSACKNQGLLNQLASASTSCGRFKTFGYQHCGRCVPCLIRRAAFVRARRPDGTGYKYANLGIDNAEHMRFNDVTSAKIAVMRAHQVGVDRWLGAQLASPRVTQRADLVAMIGRGLDELEALLNVYNVK
jgi:hypothetical protein